MRRLPLAILLSFTFTVAHAQRPTPAPAPASPDTTIPDAPLPPIRELLLDAERNQKLAEAKRKDYTYHVHIEQQDFDSKGALKKTVLTDSESITVAGVRINRVTARNGKPLTPDEAKKESERIDKEVAKDKERRANRDAKGQPTDTRGDTLITASRVLELGVFTNPRRVSLNGRPTIVFDYAGDPKAKTRNSAEGIIRDLVGVVWIDEQDRVVAQAQGHFLNDFKLLGGLAVDIHKGLAFEFHTSKINNEVWLPSTIDGNGSARILLFTNINGRLHMTASDYRKFRASSTILPGNNLIGPDGNPLPPDPATPPTPAPNPNH
jgi:hypothetical protein